MYRIEPLHWYMADQGKEFRLVWEHNNVFFFVCVTDEQRIAAQMLFAKCIIINDDFSASVTC